MSDWKEYIIIIISVATLVVAIAAFIVAKRSLRLAKSSNKYAIEKDKKDLQHLLASKEEQLASMQWTNRFSASDVSMNKETMLKAEIKQLKQQLKEYE